MEDLRQLLENLSRQVQQEADGEIETSDEFKAGFRAGAEALKAAFLATVD